MITSESKNTDFRRFFDENINELLSRLKGLLMNKYRRHFVKHSNNLNELPPVFGMLKLNDVTIYGLPVGLKFTKAQFQINSVSCFLVMKDLRTQTRIMVTDSHPSVILYSTHAISRYRERLNLDANMDFVDVCKHMLLSRCSSPKVVAEMNQVYGTNINHRVAQFVCLNGAFLGYYSGETDMLYAQTFLSTNEFREDQGYLDANGNNEYLKKWKETQDLYMKGELSIQEAESRMSPGSRAAFDEGSIRCLTSAEIAQEDEELKKMRAENPNYLEDQTEINRVKALNRLKRKGYK